MGVVLWVCMRLGNHIVQFFSMWGVQMSQWPDVRALTHVMKVLTAQDHTEDRCIVH